MAISTHAPRTGSDVAGQADSAGREHFNPRSPHGERLNVSSIQRSQCVFQPTLPARGATYISSKNSFVSGHFNPRSPHGERPCAPGSTPRPIHNFNPRSPHGERRTRAGAALTNFSTFQPTLPARGATELAVGAGTLVWIISTHAPRTGSDLVAEAHAGRDGISTHAPRTGSDTAWLSRSAAITRFQPTLPARGATR